MANIWSRLNQLSGDAALQASLEILRTRSSRYAWYGTFIASCAVVLACLLVAQHFHGGISYQNVLLAQRENVAIWVLDCMPFLFAIWGQVVSLRMTRDASSAIKTRTLLLRHDLRRERFNARLRTDYFARLSHEFRTPLNAILGLSETLLARARDGELQGDIRVIQNAAENLLTLVNDVLDFSAIEAGHVELDRVEFDVRECIQNACLMLRAQARRKGLELLLDIDAAVPTLITGDPGRLRQILVNLIGNAIKFTDSGLVRCDVETQDARDGGRELVVRIRDTGRGMDERTRKHLFKPYRRDPALRQSNVEGTGLGLAITHELISAMRGAIAVDSEPGRGTTFTVRLPFEQQHGIRLASLARNIELRGVPLLLVDSPGEERARFEAQLRTLGIDVTVVGDGVDALQEALRAWLNGRPYEMLVTDLSVEHLDGIALAEALRRRDETRDICLVATTSAGTRGDALRVKAAGFSGYFTKPLPPEHVGELLRATLATLALPEEQRESRGLITRHYIRENVSRDIAVLLVEDDKVSLEVTRNRLESLGCRVITASTGADGVLRAAENDVHLILFDYHLPDMRGDQAVEQLAQVVSQYPLPPVVMFSAGLTQAEKQRCRKAGAVGFLEKPADRHRLLATLERYCELPPAAEAQEVEPAPEIAPALRKVFVRESLSRMADVEKAIGAQLDKEVLLRTAHTMRSSARHVGALVLAAEFDRFHEQLASEDDRAIRRHATELLARWEDVVRVMDEGDTDRTVTLAGVPRPSRTP